MRDPRRDTIAVAARELEGPPRGVSRWLKEILGAWRTLLPPGAVTLYVEQGAPPDFDTTGFTIRVTDGPSPTRRGATAWEQLSLARALREDRPAVVLGPANSIPLLAATNGVAVIHDLSFEAHPEWFQAREGARLRILARCSAHLARRVVVVSEFTAGEVALRYGVPHDRLRVAPNGVSPSFRPVCDRERIAATRERLGLSQDVILSVGSLFTRRRIVELVAAFAEIARTHPTAQLVLVGDDRLHPRVDLRALLARSGIADRTLWLERVSEDTLLDLYSLAAVSVYLSDYEGFGLPPLEAIACGAPVLASAATALGDNLRGHATLLAADEHTPRAIAAALRTLLATGVGTRERPPWLDRFSWRSAAETVLGACREAAR